MSVDLFPPDALMAALDGPSSLLDDLDAAGKKAAEAFDHEPGATQGVRSFLDVLKRDPGVPRATRKRLTESMPTWWEAITEHARSGRLATMVARLEADDLLGGEPSDADGATHPVLAYVNEVGADAAKKAFEAYRAELPLDPFVPPGGTLLATEVFERATSAASERFASSLTSRVAGDFFAYFEREAPAPVFWTTMIAAAAGALGALVVAPKTLTDAAASAGLSVPPIRADVDVATLQNGLEIRFGGNVRIVPGGLTDGPIWQQALDTAFGASAHVDFHLDDQFDLTAGVSWAPENGEWGVKLTFTLLRF